MARAFTTAIARFVIQKAQIPTNKNIDYNTLVRQVMAHQAIMGWANLMGGIVSKKMGQLTACTTTSKDIDNLQIHQQLPF